MFFFKKISKIIRSILANEIECALIKQTAIEKNILFQNRERLLFDIKSEQLTHHAMYDNKMGVCSDFLCDEEVVVSLTTYGKRLQEVYLPIESIMQGTVKPNRIILWLEDSLQDIVLPVFLQNQIKRGLQIEYCKDLRSYKKLIPTLKKYPDATILTIDDDAIYAPEMLERMLQIYKEFPKNIIANRVHTMTFTKDGSLNSYLDWKRDVWEKQPSPLNFLTGVGGVLYPAHCFDKEVLNETVFMDICRFADDVWFYSMALKNGYIVKKAETKTSRGEVFLDMQDPMEVGLCAKNASSNPDVECRNDIQIKAVFEKYGIYQLLKKQ